MNRRPAWRVLVTVALLASFAAGSAPAWGPVPENAAAAVGRGVIAADTDPSKPLMIVIDMSTSMDETDGAGDVKLQKAKEAVDAALRMRADSDDTGVWAFPEDGDCTAGAALLEPGSGGSVVDAIANVDKQVSRAGGTPIGLALQAAVGRLEAKGYGGANVLLVTDGACGSAFRRAMQAV